MTRKGYDIDHLISLLKNWKNKYGHQVYMEPGEAFGWGTGVLKATVLDIKPAQGKDLPNAILNVSATRITSYNVCYTKLLRVFRI